MERRNFLKVLGASLLARKLPAAALHTVNRAAVSVGLKPIFVSYSLGFSISKELLDDDVYTLAAQAMLAKQARRDEELLANKLLGEAYDAKRS